MHFAQFKAYSECNSCTPGLSAITATAPLWATIQTTALAKVLSKSLSCRAGNKVAGVQSADVKGGDQQVDKRGQAVLQTGTNTAYPVHPCAHPYNPRASTCSLADRALCPNILRAKDLLLPQVPCPSPRLFQLSRLWCDLCFLLVQHQWMNWAKAKMVLSALSKEPLSLHNCFCCRQPGVEFSKYYTGMKSDATHHHTILGFFLELSSSGCLFHG